MLLEFQGATHLKFQTLQTDRWMENHRRWNRQIVYLDLRHTNAGRQIWEKLILVFETDVQTDEQKIIEGETADILTKMMIHRQTNSTYISIDNQLSQISVLDTIEDDFIKD